mmetsp:Transcript_37737/g.57781  ORF Transcript_37737/g.57781 Transcript_37737/m.57781 type:complete len:251 (-) Transcript_37737:751-1503(-)
MVMPRLVSLDVLATDHVFRLAVAPLIEVLLVPTLFGMPDPVFIETFMSRLQVVMLLSLRLIAVNTDDLQFFLPAEVGRSCLPRLRRRVLLPEKLSVYDLWVAMLDQLTSTTACSSNSRALLARFNSLGSNIADSALRLPLPLLALEVMVVFVLLSDLREVPPEVNFPDFFLFAIVFSLLALLVRVIVGARELIVDELHIGGHLDGAQHVDRIRHYILVFQLTLVVLGDEHRHVQDLVGRRPLTGVHLQQL